MEIDTSIYIVAICIIIALIGGRKLRKSMVPLLRLGIILFSIGLVSGEDMPQPVASSQQPIIAPSPEQFVEACHMFSNAFGQSDYDLFFYTDIYMIGLNNSSVLNLTA